MASKVPTTEKFEKQDFDLFGALAALDKKDYTYLDNLTEEQVKKFVPYMLLHWMSAIKGGGLLGSYYVVSTDAHANKYMFNEYVQKHPKLQWMMLCAASPGMGKQFHQWIPHLSNKIGELKESAKLREVSDYFQKIYKNVDESTLQEVSKSYTLTQNHKHRIARLYPNMKVSDIEVMAEIVSSEDLDEYEREAGN